MPTSDDTGMQLLVLDFVREANAREMPIRKSDVVKGLRGRAAVITEVINECIADELLESEKMSLNPGRPSEVLRLTQLGKMTLMKRAGELIHQKENAPKRRVHRLKVPSERVRPAVMPDEDPTSAIFSKVPSGVNYEARYREMNALQDVPWTEHIWHEGDLHWSDFVVTPEIVDVYGADAAELARYYAARYGERVVSLQRTLLDAAPERWREYTVADVSNVLTLAEMTHRVRSTFFYEEPLQGDPPDVVRWQHWHIVAEADVLDWVSAQGRDNVLAMLSEWGKKLY